MFHLFHRSVLALGLLGSAVASAAANETYTLAPGDHVQVKVSDFRAGTGEAYQWTSFTTGPTDDFIVGPDGVLSLPVVGAIDAVGKTTADLEAVISAKLQAKAGLTTRPDASVQIVKFRPFYVVGGVDKPGEYDYRPGVTVLQAIGIAGGLERVTSDALIGFLRDAVSSRGDLRVLSADRLSFLARQARLDAEMADAPEIHFPEELGSKSKDPDVARDMREEQLLFESRRTGLDGEVATLERNKTYLLDEIESLHKKGAAIDTQIASMRNELAIYTGLVNKGLSALPRQLELEQNLAQIQANQLDVQIAVQRATEDIAKSDRDIIDLKATRRNDTLAEAADVRVKLAETIEKIQTSRALVEADEVRAPALLMTNVSAYDKPNYFISHRDKDGKMETVAAQESDLVRPGDVVRVVPQSSPDPSVSAASGGVAN